MFDATQAKGQPLQVFGATAEDEWCATLTDSAKDVGDDLVVAASVGYERSLRIVDRDIRGLGRHLETGVSRQDNAERVSGQPLHARSG